MMQNSDSKQQNIKTFYLIANNALLAILNFRKMQKFKINHSATLKKLENSEYDSEEFIVKKEELSQKINGFKEESAQLEEMKKTSLQILKMNCIENREYISAELEKSLFSSLNDVDTGVSDNIDDALSSVESSTGVSYDKVVQSANFSTTDFYDSMAVSFHKVGKGLEKVIEQLQDIVDELEELIVSHNTKIETNSAPIKDSPQVINTPQKKVQTISPSVVDKPSTSTNVDIDEELAMMEYGIDQDIQEESLNNSASLSSIIGNTQSKNEPTNTTKKENEDEEESTHVGMFNK